MGDAKYKRMKDERVPNADLYQMLAYATSLGEPGGLPVYAEGDAEGGPYSSALGRLLPVEMGAE